MSFLFHTWRTWLWRGLAFSSLLFFLACGGVVGEGQNLLLCRTNADCPKPAQGEKEFTCILNLCQKCLPTGSAEICNGLDDNCDGRIDEGPNPNEKAGEGKACDVPGGIGPCKPGKTICDKGFIVCKPDVAPAKAEICGNGIDDDCDGKIDNGCACKPGDSRACYENPVGCTKEPDGSFFCKGLCKAGQQSCEQNGTWGACTGSQEPVSEKLSCGDGKDNDCDGQIDNGCQCSAGDTQSCYPPNTVGCVLQPDKSYRCEGLCKTGTQACQPDGTFGPCKDPVVPSTELCDGLDNNCDGQKDETCACTPGETRQCYDLAKPGCKYEADRYTCTGICKTGVQNCRDGKWSECQNAIEPNATEICGNGTDDNCDGRPDEDPPCECVPGTVRECYPTPDIGCIKPANPADPFVCKPPCKAGLQLCDNLGKWRACNGAVGPSSEICDGKDNNCDGQIDEGCGCRDGDSRLCGSNIGECKQGIENCAFGRWGPCVGEIKPTTEICDGKDNNCDGKTDEGCACVNGNTRLCGSNVGECRQGLETCVSGQWGACTGGTTPTTELCDLKDNNCDGQIDEGCACTSGATRPCGSNVGECRQGSQTCTSGAWGNCIGDTTPVPEICDNKDNDCDGKTDETLSRSCYTGAAATKGVGECSDGTQVCAAGVWGTCTGQTLPQTEICDNKDNNCDGRTDEALTRPCYTGPAGTQGVGECKGGTQTCTNGTFAACVGEVVPKAEIANSKDDDCDGKVDEGTIPLGCKSGTNSQESGQWANMVGCDCTSAPCSVTTATTGGTFVCATGWQVCTFAQWASRFNGILSNKRRYIRAKMVCRNESPDPNACLYPINADGSSSGKVYFTDGELCDASSTNECGSTNNDRPMLFFVTAPVVENSNGCPTTLTSAQQTYATSIGLVSRGNSVTSFYVSSGNKRNNCLADTTNAVQGAMCCR